VVTDHIENGGMRSLRVVQIGNAIGKAWAQVQQGERGFVSHASVAICRSRDHTFKQTEHGPNLRLLIKGRD